MSRRGVGLSSRATTDYRQDMKFLRTRPQKWMAGIVTLVALAIPFILDSDVSPPLDFPWSAWFTNINLALIAVIAAAAFNLLLGYTHQISVAHAAFLMLGTMVFAYFGNILGWPFWVVIPVAAVWGAGVGAVVGLPALRLRGLYLLIATFGFHFLALFVYKKFLTRYFGFNAIRFDPPEIPFFLQWLPFIHPDEDGLYLIDGNFRWYWVLLPAAVISVVLMSNVIRTREGRAFQAVAQYDVSASLIGISVTKSKVLAFALSSAFVAMSAVLGGSFIGARGEDSFPFAIVLAVSIMVIVGGFATMQGAIFGAFFFYLVPVFLDWIRADWPVVSDVGFLQTYQNETNLAVFGALIMVVLIWKPAGLTGIWNNIKGYFRRWPFST